MNRVVLELPGGGLTLEAEGRWQRNVPEDDCMLTGIVFPKLGPDSLEKLLRSVFESAQEVGRFLFDHTSLRGMGLVNCVLLAQNYTRYRDIAARRTIYRQDTFSDFGNAAFIVVRGRVALQLHVRGDVDVTLDQLETGDIFGGTELLAETPHLESAVAQSDVRLLEISANTYRFLSGSHPFISQQLTQVLIRLSEARLRDLLVRVGEGLSQ